MSGPDSITKTVTKTVKTFRAAMQVGVRGASRPRSHRRITAAVRTGPPPGRLSSLSRTSRTRDCTSSSTRRAIATGGGPCGLVTNGVSERHLHGNATSHPPPPPRIAKSRLPWPHERRSGCCKPAASYLRADATPPISPTQTRPSGTAQPGHMGGHSRELRVVVVSHRLCLMTFVQADRAGQRNIPPATGRVYKG